MADKQTVEDASREFLESVGCGYYIKDPDNGSFIPVDYIDSPVFEQDLKELKQLLIKERKKQAQTILKVWQKFPNEGDFTNYLYDLSKGKYDFKVDLENQLGEKS